MGRLLDLAGHRYEMFTFIRLHDRTQHGAARWVARCDCGTEKVVIANAVRNGNTKSCGCLWLSTRRGLGLALANRAKKAALERNQETLRIGKKRCIGCNRTKPLSCFIKRERTLDGHDTYCRRCSQEKDLNRLYGISAADKTAMLKKQSGRCAICSRRPGAMGKFKLHVDHDHKTRVIRGLLCGLCNTAIGKFKDDPLIIERAAAYLRLARPDAPRIPRK